MADQGLSPRMQNAQATDLGSQVARVGGDPRATWPPSPERATCTHFQEQSRPRGRPARIIHSQFGLTPGTSLGVMQPPRRSAKVAWNQARDMKHEGALICAVPRGERGRI
jgi:hypothetical protein